jgi:long-chain fatty acid transport protein
MSPYRTLALLLGSLTMAGASGVRIPHQDAAATARADAFVATADTPSAVFYNPAGMTQLPGFQARVGDFAVTIDVEHQPPGGGSYGNKFRVINVPHAFYTWTPNDSRLSLGLGVNSPFGLYVEYPDDSPSRLANKKAKLVVLSIAPAAAWRLTDTLSIGVSPTVNYGTVQDFNGIAVPGDGVRIKGTDWAYGFNVGILWKPSPKHAFGLTYHSGLNYDFSGHTNLTVKPFVAAGSNRKVRLPEEDSTFSIDLPQFVVLGYSFRPTPAWNLEVNVDWTDWDNLNSAPLRQQTSPPVEVRFDWRSGFIYEAGVTHTFGGGFHASAGYAFSESNVPESTFNPAIPDGDRHVLSAGLGRRGTHFDWDVAYQYSLTGFRDIDNDGPADGRWRLQSHAVIVSVGCRF